VISAVIVNWNGRLYLDECLSAVLAQRPAPDEVLVVDNHSDDGSRELVAQRFPGVRVVDTGSNDGPARARNVGLREARHDDVLLLDNDVVLQPGALERLAAVRRSRPEAAVVQARSLCADRMDLVHYDAADLHYLGMLVLRNWFAPLANAGGTARDTGAFVALCVLCDRRAVLQVGGFCERMFILYEDNQLAYKLRLAGRAIWHEPNALCLHKGGTAGLSLRSEQAAYPARRVFLHTRNRALLLRTCMHWRTLLVTWPARAVYGVAQLAFSIARGHLGAWLEAQVELVRLLPETLRARRIVQRSRVVADRDLLIAEPLTLNPGIASRGIGAAVRRTLDAAFCGWWRLVRGLCG
jgi:GT2 family glycosyltransferase